MEDDYSARWEGRGADLHAALDDAWHNNALKAGAEPGRYVVESIEIEVENPIRTYIVIITPTG
jgi:hypothetical protein